MKLITAIIMGLLAVLFLSIVPDLPIFSDPLAPANDNVARYYVENAYKDGHVPNFVTAVLADYRGFDTMFETCVVFIAGISIFSILFGLQKEENKPKALRHDSVIVRCAARFMVPLLQLFSLYVVAHGHHSPGGGFQGGVMLGASLILIAIAYDFKTIISYLNFKGILISAFLGVIIFAGIGLLCMFMGGNFLDYSVLAPILPLTDSVMARSHGMLGVEIGVAFTVMSIMLGIYLQLASNGRMDDAL